MTGEKLQGQASRYWFAVTPLHTQQSSGYRATAEARHQVIIDHSGRLHEGITYCLADKTEPAALEILAHGCRFGSEGGNLVDAAPGVFLRLAADKAPDVAREAAEFALHGEKSPGVVDCRRDLQTVAYDSGGG